MKNSTKFRKSLMKFLKNLHGMSGKILIAKFSSKIVLSLVYTSAPNGLRTKCAYVWTGLRTCAAPSGNSSHTARQEPKFVGFLRKHKENWMRRVSFPCTGYSLLASDLGKINAPHANSAACKRRARVYKALESSREICRNFFF